MSSSRDEDHGELPDEGMNRDSSLSRSKELLSEFISRRESGESVVPEEYFRKYPELEQDLKKLFEKYKILKEEARESARTGDSGVKSQVIGDFVIIREIGRGGMGIVYEAEQTTLKRKVALKVLPSHLSFSDDAVLKFRREAEAGGRQSHPGLVSVYAVGEQDGTHFIAQELVESGFNLETHIKQLKEEGDPPSGYFREVAELVAEIGDALHHAHEVGVIHRDIKPSNILLTQDGNPKVTDFGLAKVEDALALSRSGELSGTPFYMSPEQAASRRIGIDRRTDIFSLGVTLYEMLTFERPFQGENAQEVLRNILLQDPKDPRKLNHRIPRDLAVITLKALEKMPERRFQTMQELSEDLRRFLQGEMIQAKPSGPMTQVWKQVKRRPFVSFTTCLSVLVLLFLIVVVPWIVAQNDRENLQEILRLSDSRSHALLLAEAERLWPEVPERIGDFEHWLMKAHELLGRLDDHRNRLEELTRFEDIATNNETRWQRDILQELITGLEKLSDEDGLIMDVETRLAFARSVSHETVEKYSKEWDEARASISNPEECPMYKGLVLKPQIGLIPIGRDPESGLWEFAHFRTGEIPRRGQDDKLLLWKECGLVFVLIPGGTFRMGCVKPDENNPMGAPNVHPDASRDEGPDHEVTIKPFYLSKYEMTQGQWVRFNGYNPSGFAPGKAAYGSEIASLLNPIENMTWEEAHRTLSRLDLRLPSESEWEYAARSGTNSTWWTGNDKASVNGVINLVDQYAKTHSGSSLEQWTFEEDLNDGHVAHAQVNSYPPNPFGLHEILGNVWEWCLDTYQNSYVGAPCDGSAWETVDSQEHVSRGGSWATKATHCRCSYRNRYPPGYRKYDTGCRPAISVK